jgi:3-oxoacyl-[acyl-carrier protein] reductase
MKIDYKGQTVLVTGATRGIGLQVSTELRKLGANLILTGTNKSEIDFLNKNKKEFYHVDFLDDKSTENFINYISEIKIDVLINNAGINRIDFLEEVDNNDWKDVLKVNLSAPYLIMKTVSKNMIKNEYGRIINISSIWGIRGKEKRVCYSTSKAGLVGLTLSSAAELAKYNVLVNSISPGFTLTDLTKKILGDEGMKELSEEIPMRRMAETSEISKVILFMASELNTYMSGQNIIVDGGFTSV